jgi:hypothetical protein
VDNFKSKRLHGFKNSTKDEKMGWLETIKDWIFHPIRTYKERKMIKKRMEELRKRDPFIYK